MPVPFLDSMPACCPRCRRRDAVEWPILDDVRSFFCRTCMGFKIREKDSGTLAAVVGAGLFGQLVSHAIDETRLAFG